MSVYFIRGRGTNIVKIGWTDGDPGRRLKALQTGTAFSLQLMASRPGTQADEKALHDRFAADRVNGEWFRMSPGLAAEVALSDHGFARLAAMDPLLLGVARRAGDVGQPGDKFCANAVWYGYDGYGLKEQMYDLVGWGRAGGPPELKTMEAYSRAYTVLYELLPDCVCCGCMSPGFVAEADPWFG